MGRIMELALKIIETVSLAIAYIFLVVWYFQEAKRVYWTRLSNDDWLSAAVLFIAALLIWIIYVMIW